MKKLLFSLLIALMFLSMAGCQPTAESVVVTEPVQAAAPAAVTEESPETPPDAEIVLTMTGLDGKSVGLSMEELRKLPAAEGQAGIKSSTGKITPPALFKGVLITELLKQMGAEDGAFGIEVEAEDGYAMTLSSEQLANGEFIAYDPATGDETQDTGPLQAIVAYEMDGQPLDIKRDGTLRLVVISEKNNQVTDGHWSIKWVRKITVKQLAMEWNLALEGGIVDTVDRGSFESCSTSKCHQAAWTDETGQAYTGTPLWLFAGRSDDDIKHGTGSFNLDLYEKSYTVEVVGKDGYSAIFDIARLIANKDIILANHVNDNPLTDEDFPLILVGPDVAKKEAVGGIEKIILHFGETAPAETPEPAETPAAAEPAETAELPEGKALMINGQVDSPLTWSMDELKALEVVKMTVEHPKKGSQNVEGVRLLELLKLAGGKVDAKNILFTAGDGFTVTSDLKTILDCKDCLVVFDDPETLRLAMPGLDSGLWVKEIIAITIQ
ncbi:MAG: molybdopterin-dependent oxidoreductase [Anaerolineaceae bacterium]